MQHDMAQEVVAGLKEAGVNFISYLPDSWLNPSYTLLSEDPHFMTMPCTNEGEGAALCAGAWLGGMKPALLMENSGLRAASESIARLGMGFGIPLTLIMSYRGQFGDKDWWAYPSGLTMEPFLQGLRIPYEIVRDRSQIRTALVNAQSVIQASRNSACVIFGKEICSATI